MPHALKVATCSVGFVLSMLSCDNNIVGPALPDSASKFTPPAAYAGWWAVTEACSGLSGSFAAIQWYQAPDNVLEIDGKKVSAYWSANDNRIVVSSSVVGDGQVVRHEMLHALLREKGHSRAAFLERCAGRVTCTSQCVEDAGPAPVVPPHIPRVSPTTMEVTMEIDPAMPHHGTNGGYFSITVSVRNPAPHQVVVVLPASASLDAKVSFSCRLSGMFDEFRYVIALDASASTFAAGETKLHIFDFFIGNGSQIGQIFAGAYSATGSYGGRTAPVRGFTAL